MMFIIVSRDKRTSVNFVSKELFAAERLKKFNKVKLVESLVSVHIMIRPW